MAVERVEIHRLRLPMTRPFRSAHNTQTERDLVVVSALVDGHLGWAECAATPLPNYTSEYAAGAYAILHDHLAPAAIAGEDANVVGHPMASAALETAILDATLRATGVSLAAHLGAVTTVVPGGAALGIDDPAITADAARHLVDAGYRRIKLKIAPGHDLDQVEAVRHAVGESVALHLDANGSYGPADLDTLRRLDAMNPAVFEQPFAPDRIVDHARLAEHIHTPIALDESFTSLGNIVDAVQIGAASAVCLKIGRVGGIAAAVEIVDWCRDHGVGLYIGGMHDTALGRAVNVAFVASDAVTHISDVAASNLYFEPDIGEPFVLDDGHLAVPTEAGIGRCPDPGYLRSVTTHHATIGE